MGAIMSGCSMPEGDIYPSVGSAGRRVATEKRVINAFSDMAAARHGRAASEATPLTQNAYEHRRMPSEQPASAGAGPKSAMKPAWRKAVKARAASDGQASGDAASPSPIAASPSPAQQPGTPPRSESRPRTPAMAVAPPPPAVAPTPVTPLTVVIVGTEKVRAPPSMQALINGTLTVAPAAHSSAIVGASGVATALQSLYTLFNSTENRPGCLAEFMLYLCTIEGDLVAACGAFATSGSEAYCSLLTARLQKSHKIVGALTERLRNGGALKPRIDAEVLKHERTELEALTPPRDSLPGESDSARRKNLRDQLTRAPTTTVASSSASNYAEANAHSYEDEDGHDTIVAD